MIFQLSGILNKITRRDPETFVKDMIEFIKNTNDTREFDVVDDDKQVVIKTNTTTFSLNKETQEVRIFSMVNANFCIDVGMIGGLTANELKLLFGDVSRFAVRRGHGQPWIYNSVTTMATLEPVTEQHKLQEWLYDDDEQFVIKVKANPKNAFIGMYEAMESFISRNPIPEFEETLNRRVHNSHNQDYHKFIAELKKYYPDFDFYAFLSDCYKLSVEKVKDQTKHNLFYGILHFNLVNGIEEESLLPNKLNKAQSLAAMAYKVIEHPELESFVLNYLNESSHQAFKDTLKSCIDIKDRTDEEGYHDHD